MQRGVDAPQAAGVRHEVSLDGDARQPGACRFVVGDEQQVIRYRAERIGDAIDDPLPPDAFQALGQPAVPRGGTTGEDDTGAGEAHVIPGSGGSAAARSPHAR